jgi:hypothetical protein
MQTTNSPLKIIITVKVSIVKNPSDNKIINKTTGIGIFNPLALEIEIHGRKGLDYIPMQHDVNLCGIRLLDYKQILENTLHRFRYHNVKLNITGKIDKEDWVTLQREDANLSGYERTHPTPIHYNAEGFVIYNPEQFVNKLVEINLTYKDKYEWIEALDPDYNRIITERIHECEKRTLIKNS